MDEIQANGLILQPSLPWFLLVQTPAEGVEGAPWSAGQKTSGLGRKCKMSLIQGGFWQL